MKKQSSRESKVFSIHGEGKTGCSFRKKWISTFPIKSTLKFIQDTKFNVKFSNVQQKTENNIFGDFGGKQNFLRSQNTITIKLKTKIY